MNAALAPAHRAWLPVSIVLLVSASVMTALLFARTPLSAREARLVEIAERISRGEPDEAGRRYPLLVHDSGEVWHQPLAIYPTALLLRAGAAHDLASRAPSALAGFFTMWLTYVLAQAVCTQTRTVMLAAALVLLTPALIDSARTGGAALMMAPPILFWLTAVHAHLVRPRPWLLVLGGLVLGISLYSQPAGVIAALMYLVIGGLMLRGNGRTSREVLIAASGLLAAALPLLIWFIQSPPTYPDTFGRWAIHAAHVRDPWQGWVAFTALSTIGRRVATYWDYLSPTYLFLSASVFPAAMSVLVLVGLWARGEAGRAAGRRLVTAGFFAAPIAAVLLDEPRTTSLALLSAPFGALLASRGAEVLLADRRRPVRACALGVLGAVVLERLLA